MPKPLLPLENNEVSGSDFAALLYFIQGDYKQALKLLKEQLATNPQNPKMLIYASVAAFHAGAADDYAVLTQATNKQYPSALTAYNLGVFSLMQGNYKQTLDIAQKVFDNTDNQYVRDLTCVLMSQAHTALGDFEAAEDAILTVAESEKLPLDVQKEMALVMGQVDINKGHYDAASVYLNGLTGDKLLASSAWNELGFIEVARDNIPAAISFFRKAFDADPQDDDPLLNIVNTYQSQGMDAACIRYLEYLVAKMPDDPSLLEFLGISYRRCGALQAAEHTLRRGLAADPDNRSLQT